MPQSLPTTPVHSAGPGVAWLFVRLLGINLVIAWASLASQVKVLIGSRGLLPVTDLFDIVRARPELGFWDVPTWLWLNPSDGVISAGTTVGIALGLLVTLGIWWRPGLLLSAVMYLGYIHAGRDFLGFQWDNLLVEVSVLAACLPVRPTGSDWLRSGRWVHLSLRLVLFKVFFESGLAKWQSAAGDWTDGSAMTRYYETAPLPTWLGWYAHHLPESWHHIESWWTLFFELFVPFLIFGTRPARVIALAVFGGFVLIDGLTANYGFFLTMTVALLALLLDERDVARFTPTPSPRPPRRLFAALALLVGLPHAGLSAFDGLARFADVDPFPTVLDAARPLRFSNVYHLFGTITTTRIEPEFQVRTAEGWTALQFHHKPGDPLRRPGFVAPHQPRVDFQLWFYGLHFQHRTDTWVATLVQRLCDDPSAVQPLFATPLPPTPDAVRLVFWDTRFSSSEEHAETGAWWTLEELERSRDLDCR